MMGGVLRPYVVLLLGVAACTGPAMRAEGAPAGREGGPAPGPDAGSTPAEDGGALYAPSGFTPGGYTGALWDAGLAGDGAVEAGLPPRIGGDAAWVNAVPGAMPQVVNSGGPTLTSPVFQSVTFANYDQTGLADDFVSRVGLTSYWVHAVGEYGIGLGRAAPPVHLLQDSPQYIDDAQIQTWLANELATDDRFEPPSSGTLYVIFYPFSSSVTFDGQESCFTMGAYHSSVVVGGVNVAYAVVPECTTETATSAQTTTSAASHELIEAVTDPFSLVGTAAYAGVDPGHAYFPVVLGGAELADLCAQWPASFFVPDDLPYMVQRTWSNAAVAAGRDPCQPELDGETFFNAVPTMTDTVHVGTSTPAETTLGLAIAPGQSKVVEVLLYSEADVGPWNVTATSIPIGGSNLSFAWDKTTGNNGDVLHLTVTANYVEPSYGGEPFLIESTLGGQTNYWLGYVGQ
jgi:hypothetical protein